MSDARLRELQRAASRGDVNAQAALITARLRSGLLERERIEYAARVGCPAATLCVGHPAPLLVGHYTVSTGDIISIIKYCPMPRRFASRWAAACLRTAAVDLKSDDRQLFLLLDDFDVWIESNLTTVVSRLAAFASQRFRFQDETPAADFLMFGATRLAWSISTIDVTRWRDRIAEVVSCAYHASNCAQSARAKQKSLLIEHLLGDYPWD